MPPAAAQGPRHRLAQPAVRVSRSANAGLLDLAEGRGDVPRPRLLRAAGADRAHETGGERSARARSWPTGGRRRERNEDLEALLEAHQGAPGAPRSSSTWAPSTGARLLHTSAGAWEEAWAIASSAPIPAPRRGRPRRRRARPAPRETRQPERLEQLFAEIEGRDIGGSAGELIAGAKQGLWRCRTGRSAPSAAARSRSIGSWRTPSPTPGRPGFTLPVDLARDDAS